MNIMVEPHTAYVGCIFNNIKMIIEGSRDGGGSRRNKLYIV